MRILFCAVLAALLMISVGCASIVDNPKINPEYAKQLEMWQQYADKVANHKIIEFVGTEKEPVKIVGKMVYYGPLDLAPPPGYHPPPGNFAVFMQTLGKAMPYAMGAYGLHVLDSVAARGVDYAAHQRPPGPVNTTQYTFNGNANANAGAGSVEWNIDSKNPAIDNSATAPPVVVGGP